MIRLMAAACGALIAAGFSTALTAQSSAAGPITIQIVVTNVRAATGRVHVDICRKAEFLKECPIGGDANAVKGTTIITVSGLAPGDYAVQAYYDQNGNNKLDRALFGVPKEGVGFSNDAPIRLGPPKWTEAVFAVAGDKRITLRLRYFIGGDNKP